jgi:hypothetical protein
MKKYASLIFLAFLLNGCDDGDLTVDQINFDSVTPVSCSTATEDQTNTGPKILYKLKPQEAFILQLPKANGLINDPGVYTYDIDANGNGQYRVLYRAYNGTVAKDNICGTIPPSSPNVTEEWIGTAGKIEISTAQYAEPEDVNGATRISAYNHTITFRNITFLKPSGPQVQAEFDFGVYKVDVPKADLTFQNTDTGEAFKCDDNKKIYNYNASFTLTVENLDPALLVNEATPPNQPRSQAVTTTTNKVVYRNFVNGSGSITNTYNFCTDQIPTLPLLNETWIGADTDANRKATIEVTTEKIGDDTFIHTVVLKYVKLTKDQSFFQLGNSFLLGKITVKTTL